MTDSPAEATEHFAVLIGINAYVGERPLKGCVRDVEALESYLSGVYPDMRPKVLTAPESSTCEPGPSLGNAASLPTYDNVRAAIRDITARGKRGDNVLIHYSGHGTRTKSYDEDVKPSTGAFVNTSTGDLALVLLEGPSGDDCRYFRSLELAQLIKEMVDKGLLVTLILDCCFSGSLVRRKDSEHARFLEYRAEVDEKYPPDSTRFLQNSNQHTCRDSSTLPQWIVNPKGFTILTACEPHEIAREIDLPDGRRGALSYLLLMTLSRLSGRPYRQREIHQQLYARFMYDRFKQGSIKQTPMLFGNQDLSFFGPDQEDRSLTDVLVYQGRAHAFRLQAGQAHGFRDGDQFVLEESNSSAIFVIRAVGPLGSDLEALESNVPTGISRRGFTVKPCFQASLREISIRIAPDLPGPELEALFQEAERFSIELNSATESGSQFVLAISTDREDEFEIRDAAGERVTGAPKLIRGRERRICETLHHLVKYTHIKSLSTAPTPKFEQSFEICIIDQTMQTFEPGQRIQVKHGDEIQLKVQNLGTRNLYLYVYDLGSRWQVENLLETDYVVVSPKHMAPTYTGVFTETMEMFVPSDILDEGARHCEDILKVFVTTTQASFTSFVLPRLTSYTRNQDAGAELVEPDEDTDEDQPVMFSILTFIIRTCVD